MMPGTTAGTTTARMGAEAASDAERRPRDRSAGRRVHCVGGCKVCVVPVSWTCLRVSAGVTA